MSNETTSSAFVGQPPNTEDDYYVVRGLLRLAGLVDADPSLGYIHAARPPPANYTYTSRQPRIVAGLIIVMVAIVSATSARLFLRASMSQMRFGADDWATIAAAGFGVTYTVLQLIMAFHGGGHHIWDVTYEQYAVFYYYGIIDKVIFYVCIGFNKISLALFIRRLAQNSSRGWRYFCDFYLTTLVPYILLAVFWIVFSCNPPRAQWDQAYSGKLATPARCVDMSLAGRVLNITHVVQGVILLLSPMVILWTVQIDRARKIRLFVIWGVGAITVLCGLMRQIRADFTADLMWSYTELLIWTSLDVCIGIITISLPVMDAWLAGAWNGAILKLGYRRSSNGSRSRGVQAKTYAHGTTVHSTVGAKTPKISSDSGRGIIQKDRSHEMNILRTDEVDIRYTPAGSTWESEGMPKVFNKHRVDGLN
ncbi:uncharacterized protein BCR38DRAFT_13765 [Pseudomassariella vexata]|uniref:Rhodopsin domain-containing protein n=1 Tax=Pseudomassariella vexata TaxID=1141098 RepID=A0A1Y2EJE7_9PEZI|nr:uncharacterized protein BCR38DRAFT_13765 [Pseudomassariella vexata]ORY71597.1 hypothetical protein BCR38DRAFT_13765 [Pseudomassariella vexata]